MRATNIDYLPRYTYHDYLDWEGRWELINGIPYSMTPLPTIEHQKVSLNIAVHLSQILKTCKNCTALLPVDWKIDEATVIQPDNLVVCEEVKGKYLTKPPVMIFEIISPSSAFKDKNIKYGIYESEGVKCYIIVDISSKVAEIFQLDKENYKRLRGVQDEIVTFDLGKCKIDFEFGKIWEA